MAALIWMGVIFYFSAQSQLPAAPGWWDVVFKKGAHLGAYAVLGWLYTRGWPVKGWHAWLAAVLYGASDEVHQAFVPGRHPWGIDVLIDGVGAALGVRWGNALWDTVTHRIRRRSLRWR